MARVQADTLKTRSAAPQRRGRRPVNGNSAQGEPPEDEPFEAAEPEPEPEPAAELETEAAAESEELEGAAPVAKPRRATTAATPAAAATDELSDEELLLLGKMTRFALENGLSLDQLATRFRDMLAVYDRVAGL